MNNEDPPLALSDIQGLILRGYNYRYIRHFIFQISSDPDAIAGVRNFCKALIPGNEGLLSITTAEDWGPTQPAYCLNIGITCTGLQDLIGATNYSTVAGASSEQFFTYDSITVPGQGGPVNDAPTVGDLGKNAPVYWWTRGPGWQLPLAPSPDTELDIVVSLYTLDADSRDYFAGQLLEMIPTGSDGTPVAAAAFIIDSDPILDEHNKPTPDIHFGYHDGISQPRIAGAPPAILGAPDDLPIVPSSYFVISDTNPNYSAHPLLYDGCFGAFRLLYQDAGAFMDFINQVGDTGTGEQIDPALVAAKMCGRWFDGTPLEVSPDGPDPSLSTADLSNFAYITPTEHQKNPPSSPDTGQRCPYAAHTRRANPRDDKSVRQSLPNAEANRVRRFATAFGKPYTGTEESRGDYRGLVGFFMGADLFNQFEFLMSQWIGAAGFSSNDNTPNHGGVDPLFGPPEPSDSNFYYLDGEDTQTIGGLAQFVRTDGSLYVLLPSISALGYIAEGNIPLS